MTAATVAASPTTSATVAWRCTSGQGTCPCPPFAPLDFDTEGIGVGCKALAQKVRVESKFSQLVTPPGSVDVGPDAQPAAHAPFRLLGEHEIAVLVDRSHGIDRASDDLSVVQVQRQIISRESPHAPRAIEPRRAHFTSNFNPIDAAGEGPPQHFRQFCDRGEDAYRVAMDEHQACVRVDLPDVLEGKQVVR